jgi:death-on-curing protein
VTVYLSVAQILALHHLQVDHFGGARQVSSRAALEAAVARPHATFDGDDLYPDLAAKAAALLHSLVQNHPFVDGNKRTGAMACEFFLEINEHRLVASDEDFTELVLATARGELSQEALAIWIRQRLRAA